MSLTRDQFSENVGFPWRSLREICLEHGLGMRLNGRWRFDQTDVDAAKAIMGGAREPLPEMDDWPRVGKGVYFVQAERSLFIKIGFTTNMYRRLAMLETDNFEPLRVVAFLPGADELSEKRLHFAFKNDHERGEWFRDTPRLRRYLEGLQ